jgi:hypothetical protein
MRMSGSLKLGSGIPAPAAGEPLYAPGKDKDMRKLMAVLALCLTVSVPSFGAEHVVTRSAKVVGKDSYKAAKYSVKETGKVLKFVF